VTSYVNASCTTHLYVAFVLQLCRLLKLYDGNQQAEGSQSDPFTSSSFQPSFRPNFPDL